MKTIEAFDTTVIVTIHTNQLEKQTVSFINKQINPTYRDTDESLGEDLFNIDDYVNDEDTYAFVPEDVKPDITAIKALCDKHEAAYFRIVTI
jgi:hypothetical protein